MVSSEVDLAHQPQTITLSSLRCCVSEGRPSVWGPGHSRPGGHFNGLKRGRDLQAQESLLYSEVGRGWGLGVGASGAKSHQINNAMYPL